jgi:uncharacterized protein
MLDAAGACAAECFAMPSDQQTLDRTGLAERARVLTLFRAKDAELRAMGVLRLRMFGSMARSEPGADSDVDLIAEIDHRARFSLFGHVALQDDLSALLARSVDIATAPWKMRSRMRQRVEADAIEVF